MKINLEILNSAFICDKIEIAELNTKTLVPKMMTRRRLTRAAKIAIYLSNEVNSNNERIIYGSSFGELKSSATILNNINNEETISPTIFQNSVYNTAVSYLSMLNSNKNEILTISSGDNTSLNILKTAAIKALDGDEILLMITETLNIDKIEELNNCIDYLECGVALKVKVTTQDANLSFDNISNPNNYPRSILHMLHIAQNQDKNIVEINI